MDRNEKPITIVDVAEKAGVSKTTISRYLNGKFEFMSAESKHKISRVIEELNYRPNNLARSLKSKRSRIIGVVVSDIGSPFSSILLKGISDCCDRYGYGVMITSTDDDPRKEREYIMSMIDQRVEGLIINTTGENNKFLEQMARSGIPIILADRPIENNLFDTVRTDDVDSTIRAIEHLKERGFTKVGFFSEPLGNIGTRIWRYGAYERACRDVLKIIPQSYILENKSKEFVEHLLERFMAANGAEKKAIYATNGVTTLHIVKAMRRLKLKFPDDIGICGIDNWDWTELIGNGITVISQPTYKVGKECVKRLMFRLHRNRNAAPRLIELDCELIIRGST
ncbi:MAG: transcriptional regulator, LacI family [Firmicutes bacterium]|nr:transcriptional regulator, LacI family [Bacillota bacterium]